MKNLLSPKPQNVTIERPKKVRARHCGNPPTVRERRVRHCGNPPTAL